MAEEWGDAGSKDGIVIWRIEKLKPVRIPEDQYGKFFQGDSYILLHTATKKSGKEMNLHFWLGSETSQDEMGVAAYKTVELDTHLGGDPVQHRECEGHESTLFQSYFRATGGIQYEAGGIESGFRKVERDVYETRLLQIKGRRNVRVKRVELAASSMNQGDVFILDAGLKLYLWSGSEANRYEKAKGLQCLTKIRDERGAKPEAIVVADDPDNAEFWGTLGGTAADVKSADEGGDDAAAEKVAAKLFRVSDESGELEVTEVERDGGKLKRDMLDTKDAFILDADTEIFVWIGKGATAEEKKKSMTFGNDYLTKNSRPAWTPLTRVVEGAEASSFKGHFQVWEVASAVDFTKMYKSSGVAGADDRKIEEKEVDFNAMHKKAAEDSAEVLDDGSGELTIWRIESFDKKEIPKGLYGQFYGGDSYIVQYKYKDARGMPKALLYFWQGNKSSTDEKGASALLTKDLAGELDCKSTQVRVVQGKEPTHFCNLFKGTMLVHSGGVAGAFDSAEAGKEAEAAAAETGTKLYHVKGSTPGNTRGVQVEEKASSLNSGDCFVLKTDGGVTVWTGKGSNEQERTSAAAIADILKGDRAVTSVAEGEEDDAFWEALGGKGEYASHASTADLPMDPRLFQISNVTGQIAVEEIPNFAQEDLIDEDVMLLDTFNCVFVWIGSQSHAEEKKSAPDIAQKYINAATDGRDKDCPMILVDAGSEPDIFLAHFQGWDFEKFKVFEDPYEKRLRLMREEKAREARERGEEPEPEPEPVKPAAAAGGAGGSGAAAADSDEMGKGGEWTYEQLKAGEATGINMRARESYLSGAEFESVLGMSRDAFYAMPKWKQVNKKKETGLF